MNCVCGKPIPETCGSITLNTKDDYGKFDPIHVHPNHKSCVNVATKLAKKKGWYGR